MSDIKYMSKLAYDWCKRCFGIQVVASKSERALRIVEEALELVQIEGVPIDTVKHLVEVVYSRPIGNRNQEIGGIMVTTAVYCHAQNLSMEYEFQIELARILDKDPNKFRQRQKEKSDLGVVRI